MNKPPFLLPAQVRAEDARRAAYLAANPPVLTDEAREDAQGVLLAAIEGLWVNRWTPTSYDVHVQALYDLVDRLELATSWGAR